MLLDNNPLMIYFVRSKPISYNIHWGKHCGHWTSIGQLHREWQSMLHSINAFRIDISATSGDLIKVYGAATIRVTSCLGPCAHSFICPSILLLVLCSIHPIVCWHRRSTTTKPIPTRITNTKSGAFEFCPSDAAILFTTHGQSRAVFTTHDHSFNNCTRYLLLATFWLTQLLHSLHMAYIRRLHSHMTYPSPTVLILTHDPLLTT